MIYLKVFKLCNSINKNSNIYPYNILKNKEPDIFLFDNITVLYGNNGSGKSTILNIIAQKLNLKGKERNNPEIIGTIPYFEEFVSKYGEMSEAELMSEMLKLVAEKKKDGTFDAEQIKLVAEQVAPLLDDEQRGKMYNLLKFLD